MQKVKLAMLGAGKYVVLDQRYNMIFTISSGSIRVNKPWKWQRVWRLNPESVPAKNRRWRQPGDTNSLRDLLTIMTATGYEFTNRPGPMHVLKGF